MTPMKQLVKHIGPFTIALILMGPVLTLSTQKAQAASDPGDVGGQPLNPVNTQDEIRLAGNYLVGRGVPIDPSRSAYWYRRAADQGDPSAQDELGYFYLVGIGVSRDEPAALKWFARAASSGSQRAKLNLAVMYIRGIGASPNVHLGVKMLNDLAQSGYAVAESYLGTVYYCGYGVPMDHVTAEKWFAKGAKAGDPVGEYAMGTLYSIGDDQAHDYPKAAEFFERSVDQGYVPAMHSLGLLLVNHPEIQGQSPDEAANLLLRSASSGNWKSAAILGVLARDGRNSISRDPNTAYTWFIIAAKLGGEGTQKYLQVDTALFRKALSSSEQREDTRSAESWLAAHPHKDLFVLSENQETDKFPITEVLDLALAGTN